jgi:hypothetical protein
MNFFLSLSLRLDLCRASTFKWQKKQRHTRLTLRSRLKELLIRFSTRKPFSTQTKKKKRSKREMLIFFSFFLRASLSFNIKSDLSMRARAGEVEGKEKFLVVHTRKSFTQASSSRPRDTRLDPLLPRKLIRPPICLG